MKQIPSVRVADLRPFRLKKNSFGISLYLACHGRKKTVVDKLKNKLATLGFRSLRRMNIESNGVAQSVGSGKEFAFDSKNSQFHAIYQYYDRGYEPDVMAAIKVFLPSDGVFLDAGANWGYFSFAIAEDAAFTGKIIAVEAFPPTFNDLLGIRGQLSLPESRLDARCMAMSDGPGELFLTGVEGLYSGLIKVSDTPTKNRVVKDSLDNLKLDRLDVVKMDVEGHELSVLRGAAKTIERCRPVMILESNYQTGGDNRSDLEAILFLRKLGYKLYVPMLSDEEGSRLGLDLRELPEDRLWFRGMPFEPSQRGFFGRRINVLAVPEEHVFFEKFSLEQH